ncbi:hypothetical protein LTR53_003856 [Teratosphaeriaceae sp. CCFEE 6253]|nr:hypothetical protein LTR53_003856 [Teratosphaeriaceae sp. CCFEE 6253]
MATFSRAPTREDLEEDIEFMEVLVQSLDTGDDNYAEKLLDLQGKKAELEERLDALSEDSRPQSMDGASVQPNIWWNATMDGRPGSSTSSHTASGLSGGSRAGTGAGMKRTLPHGLSFEAEQNRHKRPTPEPSNAGTPISSSDSLESFTNVPTQATDRARLRQQQYEAVLGMQRAQEAADQRMAQMLSTQNQQPSAYTASRPNVQTTIGHSGSFQRPPPRVRDEPNHTASSCGTGAGPSGYIPSYPTAPSRSIKAEPRAVNVKSEASPSSQLVQRPRVSHSGVVDLTGSDDEDDLSEIAPTSFTPSKRPVKREANGLGRLMPGAYPAPYSNGIPGYGTANMPSGSTSNRYGLLQPPFSMTSNALGGIKYAANSVAAQLGELSHLINGSRPGSRPRIPDPHFPDADDDDLVFGGSRPLNVYPGQDELYRERYNDIYTSDPGRTKEEIETLLQNIRPDEDVPAHLRVQTPEALTITLHKYQEMGLTWLKNMEEGSNKGSILADDMGLGKTIQAISLFVTRRSEDPRCKTTLIVAPVALMRQWQQELEQKVKSSLRHRLTVFIHHGSSKKKSFRELQVYDVVITTYGSLASELKKQEGFRLRQKNDPRAIERLGERCALLGTEAYWYRVVLDEAQCIKNRNTQSAKAAFQLRAKYRLAMTGTPMMNNVDEFYSLINFLDVRPYRSWEKFRLDFGNPLKQHREEIRDRAMQKFQALCKAVMLRRTKKSTFEGQPILVLPERTTEVDNPEFSEDEKSLYEHLEKQTRLQFNRYVAEGSVGRQYSHVLVLLLRLRQAACHPHLIKDFAISAVAGVEPSDLIKLAQELEPQVVARIMERNGNFECNICFDATTNPAIFLPCGHDACAECFARITDPSNGIAAGNENGGTKAKCPNCRGEIDSKRITDFDSFKKVHQRELLTDEERAQLEETGSETESGGEEDGEEVDGSETGSETESEEDVDARGNLAGFINDGSASEGDDDRGDLDDPMSAGPSCANGGQAKCRKIKEKSGKPKKSKKGKGKKKEKKTVKENVTLADLRKLGSRNVKARKAYLRKLRNTWITSAKIEKTLELLREIMDGKEGEKVLIFSQWTSLLDLLEVPIDRESWGYRRYDGSMGAKERADAVDAFKAAPDLRIMLVSLKAGNAGLNLNMASQVIILDPFWNPFIEEQAIDRAHRLGQTRPVKVHRMLVQGTVEDRIIEIQERKRQLIGEALDESAGAAVSRLGVQELAYLFGVTSNVNQRIQYNPQNARDRR